MPVPCLVTPRSAGCLILVLTLALSAGSSLGAGTAGSGSRPNIVLIVSDDQGYADLGCFGGKEIQTPHLDRLAREGFRGTSFYVAWPACT